MPDPASVPFFRLEIARLRCHFSVLSFSATEAISQPFVFQLLVIGDELDLASLMLKPAFLSYNGRQQGFHGQIHEATRAHYRPGPACYRLTLGPRLTCLDQRYNRRVFQNLSATRIIAEVLEEHGLKQAYRFDLKKQCRERDTCFQHDESDLQFVQRLCAEEGIHYHFIHAPRRHELVFSDGLRGFRRTPIAPWSQLQRQPGVIRFAVTREGLDAPGSRAHQRAHGDSSLPFVNAGTLLPLAGHPQRDWNHMWLVTQVEHHFDGRPRPQRTTDTPYLNRFRGVPWEVGFTPPAPSPRPTVAEVQRAWLTGEPGEEQPCDPAGRVQVQFEWAQQGPEARHTTCWLPVAPGVELKTEGGTQVVVSFPKSDLDKPMIIATLQGDQSVPASLSGQSGGEAAALHCVPFHVQLDWQAMLGHAQKLHLDDGSTLFIERGSELLLQSGDSQVRFDADGMTLISSRITLDTLGPAPQPEDPDDPDAAG